MKYLPDTNVWISYLNPVDSPVKNKLIFCDTRQIYFCAIVKAELLFGAYNSARKEQNLEKLLLLFKRFHSLSFDDKCTEIYADIRAQLSKKGTPIGSNDLLIAAIALANDLTLVTHNTREFDRIQNLKLEDWELAVNGQAPFAIDPLR